MKEEYEIKVRGILGPEVSDDKSIRILNRCVEWRKGCIAYEADPRHAELVVRDLELTGGNSVVTPGAKTETAEEDDQLLSKEEATKYRQIVARCNFLAADRPDIQFATKECAKGMSSPKISDMNNLKRLGRYLKGKRGT